MGNEVVEKEEGSGKSRVIEYWNGFCPLGEIVDCNYDILVIVGGGWFALNEIDAPFAKGANGND